MGTFGVFFLLGLPLVFTLVIVVVEWLVHFHIDWAKAIYSEKTGDTANQPRFWRAHGLDQAMHQLSYLGIALAVLIFV